MKRTMRPLLPVVALAAAVACEDVGLPGNVPADEAARRPPMPLVARTLAVDSAVHPPIIFDGMRWLPAGEPIAIPAALLTPAGSAHGTSFWRLEGARAPVSVLYARTERGEWQPYRPVYGADAAAASGHDAASSGHDAASSGPAETRPGAGVH